MQHDFRRISDPRATLNQLWQAFSFWLAAVLVGLIGLPFASSLFARLPGRGLALARPLGLLLVGYPVWLLASAGLVPYGAVAAVTSLLLVAGLGGLVAWRTRAWIVVRGYPLRLWLVGEGLFTAGFAGWALIRSLAPDVWQTEKPMDMAIVNAINRSDSFPPHDPWLAGHDLNYYYFGHYLAAFLMRVTGVDPAIGYNLAVALYFALCASAVFAVASALHLAAGTLGHTLRRSPIVVGLVAVAFALALGNVAGGVRLIEHGGPLADYNWFSPSRVIAGTANEFPFFSFLLADLHAHVMATPFALVAVAFALQLALAGPRLSLRSPAALGELALAALVVGSLYAINTLDYPTAVAIGVFGLLLRLTAVPSLRARLGLLAWGGAWIGLSLLLFLPFLAAFQPTVHGIGIVGEHASFSRYAADVALIFGLPLWVLAAAYVARLRMPWRYAVWAGTAVVFLLTLLAPAHLAGFVLIFSAVAAALGATIDPRLTVPQRFFWVLVTVGLGLVAVGEFAYVRDAFQDTASYRFNTVFKAGYQAWYLLAIAAACGLFWSRGWFGRRARALWLAGLVPIIALVAVYPFVGSYSRARQAGEPVTLDGFRWLVRSRPDDARAIDWLRTHVHGAPTILETTGPDFDPHGTSRVSTFTGLPTVLGWAGHELQWGHDPGARGDDVAEIYSTRNVRRARALLARYDVRYVFVGSLERAEYRPPGLRKFARLGRPVFARGATVVYRIDRS